MAVQNYEVFRASGLSRGPGARADGNGGILARGFYYWRCDESLVGPFDSGMQAELVMFIESTRRAHETELNTAEQSALRALRRKDIVTASGMRLKNLPVVPASRWKEA